MVRPRRLLFALWLVGVSCCVGVALRVAHAQVQGAGGTDPIWKGVYSPAQAEKGEATYVAMCSRCHNPDLSGGQVGAERAPALGGDKFLSRWESNSVDRLFHTIRETMPRTTPGVLTDESALVLVAYILKYNGFPAGSVPLAASATLETLVFVPKDGALATRPVTDFALVEAAGCLTEGPSQVWTLTQATEPVVARAGAFGTGSTVKLGSGTLRLVSAAPFRASLKAGDAVRVKGLIRKDPDQTLINLTAVAPLGSACGR
jgi:mono/diheme cytochrome c family protein